MLNHLILNASRFFSFIVAINLMRSQTTLIKINPNKSTIARSLYILTPIIFCNTEVEKVMPPTKARTMDAKIPRIDICSFSIPLISDFKFSLASSTPASRIDFTLSVCVETS